MLTLRQEPVKRRRLVAGGLVLVGGLTTGLGFSRGRMTSSFQHFASRTLWAMEWPLTVRASWCSSGRSSRNTTGRPPA